MTPRTAAGRVPAQRRPALTELAATLRGALALPGTPAYARLVPGAAARPRPLAVVAAADAYDVAQAVRYAGAHGLRVGVTAGPRAAGTRVAGALLVDTGALDECVVHPDGWARVGAGLRWHALVQAAARSGRTPVTGGPLHAGVVGSTLAGGLGPLARTLGLAADRVRALDVVTGDGRLVRSTAAEHADLFWALRGAGSAVGLVTAAELDLVRLQPVHGGVLHVHGQDAPSLLRAWQAWSSTLPDTVGSSVALLPLPARPPVPSRLAGSLGLAVRLAVVGPAADSAALLAPLRAVAVPVLDETGPLAPDDLDLLHDAPTTLPILLRDLTPEGVDVLLRVVGPGSQSPLDVVEVKRLGGAVARPGPHPSAVRGRQARYLVQVGGSMTRREARDRFAALDAALGPWAVQGQGQGPAPRARPYDRVTLDRLRDTVAVHDPGGVLAAADRLLEPALP